MFNKQKFLLFFDITFLILFVILVMGIPLAFTSYTRSVFEVNKMLLLRYVTIATCALWLLKYLALKDNGHDNPKEKSINLFSFRFKKIGLEIPIALWLILNILSTIFSQNIRISIIGAYDRWEGIVTVINYMMLLIMMTKLVHRRFQLNWILTGLMLSTVLSAIYGVYQSLGVDFMNWSVDPTKRVFACINNPVHFCAYMAMLVPVGIGWLMYYTEKQNKIASKWVLELIKWTIFLTTALIYYAQFLSFSKATWLAFSAAMTLFYMSSTQLFNKISLKKFLMDCLLTAMALGTFYMVFFFNFHFKGIGIAVILFTILISYWCYLYFQEFSARPINKKTALLTAVTTIILLSLNFFNFREWPLLLSLPVYAGFSLYIIWMALKQTDAKNFYSRILILLLFARLQFVAVSLWSVGTYLVLLVSYVLVTFYKKDTLKQETRFWLTSFLLVFAAIIFFPSIPSHISKIFKTEQIQGLTAYANVEGKINNYDQEALKGTARTSMWKSALPWIRDYWLLGSGPDTIKYMYPKYRRSEYGILEGGHNFTPDRLHNEYLNTLATRGVIGFIIYYFGIVGGWLVIMLTGFYNIKGPIRYILMGLTLGATIYLGQVLFNFGVVATIVLFYVEMALAWAIVSHSDFRGDESNG